MATYYVGPGGNDLNNGLTWALRLLTLNAAEDKPVAAGDTVYVGPGVYRELLTLDVAGGAGNHITYVGDVTGEHTDGVGGVVRVTGSDNDQTNARSYCVNGNFGYRTFRGFRFDMVSQICVRAFTSDPVYVEDCVFSAYASRGISCPHGSGADWIIQRCLFTSAHWTDYGIEFESAGIQDGNHLVENCMFFGTSGVDSDDVGGITVRNCLGAAGYFVRVSDALPVGYTAVIVENCTIFSCFHGVDAQFLGEIVEDYNTFFSNATDRTNVNVGANSETYPPLLALPILNAGLSQLSGFRFPWWFGELSEWSQVRAITGSNEPTEDLHGILRPVAASKNSWGPLQFHDMERETGTTRGGSTASLCLHDAGRHQIFVPVASESTTISVYVYRESGYTGPLPQMILKQPGVADRITTDVGLVDSWNLLTDTFTPSADPPYVVVELVSRNGETIPGTSTTTTTTLAVTTTTTLLPPGYNVFFDDLVVN